MTQKSLREPHTALIIPDGRTRIYHTDPQLAKQRDKNKKIEREEIEIPAKNVYLGRMSSLCREYAEHFYPDNWFILTTNNQEGQPWLVHPNQPIKGEYDNPPYPIPGVLKNSDKPAYWQPFTDQGTLDNKLVNEAEKLGLLPKRDGTDGQYSRIIFLGNGTDSEWWLQKTWDSWINNKEYGSWYQKYKKPTKQETKDDDGKASRLFAPYNTQKYQYSHYIEVIKALFKDTGIWLEFPLLDYEYESQMISRLSDAIYRDFPLHHTPYSLEKISLKNLFRMNNPDFDYSDIPLGNSSHIQIITAPNGFGKSTIFRLIRAVFKGNLKEISLIPFDEASITLSSGKEDLKEDLILSINKKYSSAQQEQGYRISLNTKSKCVEITREELDKQVRDLKRWKEENQPKIKLLRKIIPPLPIRFLSSERLFNDPLKESYPYDILSESEESNLVENRSRGEEFSESFKKRLDGVLTDYAIVSHKIDTTFPVRLLENITEQREIYKDYDRIKESFSELDKKRQQLETRDFLSFRNWYSKEKNPFKNPFEPIENDLHSVQLLKYQDFLHDYLEEQNEKYKVFGWINERCQKFEDIINNLLIYTRIRIRKDTGFAFYNLHKASGRYQELELHQISSGEMQQIVMYYDFLFNCDPSTVVLIDEPEISLHVNAQENLIENIEKIAEINKIQFLIATHSPFIINSRWDITRDLLIGEYDE